MVPLGMVCSSTGFLYFEQNRPLKYGLMILGIVIVLTAAIMILRSAASKDPD
jgi:hypothetical protein